MFKKIEIWILYLVVFLGIPITAVFGVLVRQELTGSVKLGRISKAALFLSELPKNIKGGLANLIIVKTLTTVGLKHKCISCKLEVDGNEKTICFHY